MLCPYLVVEAVDHLLGLRLVQENDLLSGDCIDKWAHHLQQFHDLIRRGTPHGMPQVFTVVFIPPQKLVSNSVLYHRKGFVSIRCRTVVLKLALMREIVPHSVA